MSLVDSSVIWEELLEVKDGCVFWKHTPASELEYHEHPLRYLYLVDDPIRLDLDDSSEFDIGDLSLREPGHYIVEGE